MCECISRINADLKERGINAAIITNIFGTPHATISLYKVDDKKRGKLPILMASKCPFCGEKYGVEASPIRTSEQERKP